MSRLVGLSCITFVVPVLLATGCSNSAGGPSARGDVIDMAVPVDAAMLADSASLSDSDSDGGATCFVSTVGVFGTCTTTIACAALGGHVSTPGLCAGPAELECCTRAPNVSDNPPVPTGWKLMSQGAVTPEMTTWAVQILHDPVTYPMFSSTMRTFGGLLVMARVEWHPPDFQNHVVHRGVTLYQHI